MRRAIQFALLMILLPGSARADLRVITTTTTLRSIVEAVGKNRVRVEAIARGPQDPHYVEAKPSYMVQVRRADLVTAVGLDLEIGWISNLLQGARNPRVMPGARGYIEAGSFIQPIEVPEGKVDRAQGDIHPLGNPHFWLDPIRASEAAKGIADRLGALDPAGRDFYAGNAAAFADALAEKSRQWEARLRATGVKEVITYHRTLNYFLSRFGLGFAGSIEPKPGIPPTARHLVELMDAIKKKGRACILVESFFETATAERLVKETPARMTVVAAEVDALPGTGDYPALMERLVQAVETCRIPAAKKGVKP